MKKIFLILAFITAFCSQSAHARARIPITYGDHEKIVKVADLPEEYTTEDGVKLDLGYKYTVFEILFVPLWQTGDGKLVGYSEKYRHKPKSKCMDLEESVKFAS